VVVDGHHHCRLSLAFGGSSIPVKILADFSHLSKQQFLDVAEAKELIYPYDVYGNRVSLPTRFEDLVNDPNRYFATLCKRSSNLKGNEYPIWIKKGKELPFIELKIAKALWKAGMVYEDREGRFPNLAFYEKVRTIIHKAKILHLHTLETRTHYMQLEPMLQDKK
jgi:hypothetical protein